MHIRFLAFFKTLGEETILFSIIDFYFFFFFLKQVSKLIHTML